jgi:hypothetical protein
MGKKPGDGVVGGYSEVMRSEDYSIRGTADESSRRKSGVALCKEVKSSLWRLLSQGERNAYDAPWKLRAASASTMYKRSSSYTPALRVRRSERWSEPHYAPG